MFLKSKNTNFKQHLVNWKNFIVFRNLTNCIFNYSIIFVTKNTIFLKKYFILNDLLWQDGYLIDFIQKKIVDNWIRRFVILSAYLFNERLIFDLVVKFYLDLIIWPFHKYALFETNNVASLIFLLLLIFFSFYLILSLFFLSSILF